MISLLEAIVRILFALIILTILIPLNDSHWAKFHHNVHQVLLVVHDGLNILVCTTSLVQVAPASYSVDYALVFQQLLFSVIVKGLYGLVSAHLATGTVR